MKAEKFFVRILDSNEVHVCSRGKLLEFIMDSRNYPMRVVPLDSDGNLVWAYEFLVGDGYSLSFLFNGRDF